MTLVIGNKTYPKIDLIEIAGKGYVKKVISEEEMALYQKTTDFDFVLKPQKIDNKEALFEYLSNGNILGKNKENFIKTVEAMAIFHNRGRFINIETAKYKTEVEIKLPGVKWIIEEINQIKRDAYTVCHGDLIALNVLENKNGIKIIDWENMELGFSESDIGRFLGDLYYVNPSFERRYYDFSWHDELVNAYVNKRHELNSNYDKGEGIRKIYLGELWNYLGPIEMGLKNKDIKSLWYKKNVEAFQKTLTKVK